MATQTQTQKPIYSKLFYVGHEKYLIAFKEDKVLLLREIDKGEDIFVQVLKLKVEETYELIKKTLLNKDSAADLNGYNLESVEKLFNYNFRRLIKDGKEFELYLVRNFGEDFKFVLRLNNDGILEIPAKSEQLYYGPIDWIKGNPLTDW